jgi:hypothetical protein
VEEEGPGGHPKPPHPPERYNEEQRFLEKISVENIIKNYAFSCDIDKI